MRIGHLLHGVICLVERCTQIQCQGYAAGCRPLVVTWIYEYDDGADNDSVIINSVLAAGSACGDKPNAIIIDQRILWGGVKFRDRLPAVDTTTVPCPIISGGYSAV